MLKEFKAFIMRGNVLDLAVAVIIGAAFGAIVTSAVNDVIMPPIGLVTGNVDFRSLFVALDGKTYANLEEARKVTAPVIAYGNFINTVINFLIIAFVIFLVLKQVQRFQKPAPATAATTKDCPYCSMAIPITARKCPHCTSSLTADAVSR